MSLARRRKSVPTPVRRPAGLRTRLAEAEEALRAIRAGEVDAVLGKGSNGSQVFTLEGADHVYRVLIESMNEGALTLSPDKMILYANERFSQMVKCPLTEVIGCFFHRFLSTDARGVIRPLMRSLGRNGSTLPMLLHASDGSLLPVHISIRPLEMQPAADVLIGMVVTDMTEARRSETQLLALTRRIVQLQEAERRGVALDLHDNLTQPLCAILVRCQALAAHDSMKAEAIEVREMLGLAALHVERISRNLRPGVLNELGLVAVVQDMCTEFMRRTGVVTRLTCFNPVVRLPQDVELALYRILVESLRNVELHATAQLVAVRLEMDGTSIHMLVEDDGSGFDAQRVVSRGGTGGLGLRFMRERAASAGGILSVTAVRSTGTAIDVRIPLPHPTTLQR